MGAKIRNSYAENEVSPVDITNYLLGKITMDELINWVEDRINYLIKEEINYGKFSY